MSWRPTKYLLGKNLYPFLTNLNLSLTNLYLTNLYLTNLRRIQQKSDMHYLETNNVDIHYILRLKYYFSFKIHNLRRLFGVMKPGETSNLALLNK